jgi:hypothetical protein
MEVLGPTEGPRMGQMEGDLSWQSNRKKSERAIIL